MKKCLKKILKRSFFSIDRLVEDFLINRSCVLHVGGNHGQEREAYDRLGFERIYWIEGWGPFADQLEKNIAGRAHHVLIREMVSDIDGDCVDFSIASNGGSSTALEVTDSWRRTFRQLNIIGKQRVTCRRLDHIIDTHNIRAPISLLVLDIEGSELKALRSLGAKIGDVNAILIEVILRRNFENGPSFYEIDHFLLNNGFNRVYSKFSASSGDCLYIRGEPRSLLTFVSSLMFVSMVSIASVLRITDLFAAIRVAVKKIIL